MLKGENERRCTRRYLEVVDALSPDYFAALSDEVPSVKVDHRRAALSVDRTLAWLDQCLAVQVLCYLASHLHRIEYPCFKTLNGHMCLLACSDCYNRF